MAAALLAIGGPGAAIGGPQRPASAAAKHAAPNPGPPAPKHLEPLPPGEYTGILGKKVTDADGKDMGLLVDVIVAADRTPRAAVIDFGGFLGVGSRKIAIDWRLLNFAPNREQGQIWLSLDRAEIQGAPEYRPDDGSNEMVGPPWGGPLAPPSGK
jgi:hypothetical protein